MFARPIGDSWRMLERLRATARAAFDAMGAADYRIFCGFITPGTDIEDARACLLIRQRDLTEFAIEARAPDCASAEQAVDVVLAALERTGTLRDVPDRYSVPRGPLGFAGHVALVAF